MNELQIFDNNEFGEVRMAEIDGKPHFVATDVAIALGYSTPRDAISRHCKGVVKHDTPTLGGIQQLSYISEGDVYRLIIRSKLPSAEKFERWIFDEVIPSIRKNGGYISGQENLTDEELLSKALLVAQNKIADRDRIIASKQERIEQMRPKEIFADSVATSKNSILIGDLAKMICQNGVEIGQKRLFDWMREKGYLIKTGSSKNLPTQKSIDLGIMEVKERALNNPDGSVRITLTPKVTGKGQVYFVNKFLGEKK
jgi:anti-repressor protein|nr:MAG TPA: repressor domain protein [Bacteriophage sp.]